ncbi:hypothetical protein [Paraburkholderia aspalathi]|uniref:hypothetical protein n=1 Tax=Paraburkholderia aspalathi TaxID=1324617 RepID=UPI0038B9DA39
MSSHSPRSAEDLMWHATAPGQTDFARLYSHRATYVSMTVKPHRADTLHPKKTGLQGRSTDDAPTIDRCQPEHIE